MNVTIDPQKITLRQYRDFNKAVSTNDIDNVIALMPNMIQTWTLPGDIHDQEYWLDTLSLGDWVNITKALNEAFGQAFGVTKK